MTEDIRTPRAQEDRSSEAREPNTFVPASLLPTFIGDPDYVYRWVRIASGGQTDSSNVSARLREGWVPVMAKEIPEIAYFKDKNSRFPGAIEQGGLLLCKISKEKVQARRQYFSKLNKQQIEAVDNNFMRENDRRMPLFRDVKSEVKSSG